MKLSTLALLLTSSTLSMAQQPRISRSRLLVSGYNGSISTLELSIGPHVPRPDFQNRANAGETVLAASNGLAKLSVTDTVQGCGSSPAWMIKEANILYCLDEAIDKEEGVLSIFRLDNQSKLTNVRTHHIKPGAVSGAMYHNLRDNLTTLYVAHYSTSSISSINNPMEAHVAAETISFPGITASIDEERQTKSFPHQVVIDPTNKFLLVPDLGTDHIRIYGIHSSGLRQLPSLLVPPGTGPRHVVFWSPNNKFNGEDPMYLFVVGELSGKLIAYEARYLDLGNSVRALDFTLVDSKSALKRYDTESPTFFPAEIQISPDNRFILVSNRQDQSSTYLIPENGGQFAQTQSDTITTFQPVLDPSSNSKFVFQAVQWHAAGGSNPRHFSINKAGDLVAVALQHDDKIAIISRDPDTGLLNNIIAQENVPAQPNMVIWDE